MKLAFEIIHIPDIVLHIGKGDVVNEVIIDNIHNNVDLLEGK